MANLETLELTINANAQSASEGIEKLVGSLTSLSKKIGKSVGGLRLLNKELSTLKGFGNINIAGIAKAAKGIKEVKDAVSVPGSKLEALEMQLEGVTEAMEKAAVKGNKLSTASRRLQQFNIAKKIEDEKRAINGEAAATEKATKAFKARASVMKEFKNRPVSMFRSWMYGPTPLPEVESAVGATKGFIPDEVNRQLHPEWYVDLDDPEVMREAREKVSAALAKNGNRLPIASDPSTLDQFKEGAGSVKSKLVDWLKQKADYSNLGAFINQKMGIGAKAKSAKGSASAFEDYFKEQEGKLIPWLNKAPDYSNLGDFINQSMGIGAKGKSAKDSASVFMEQLKETIPFTERLKNAFNSAKEKAKAFGEHIKKMVPKFQMLNRVMRIASNMLIRTSFRTLFNGMKEGFDNYYKYSKAVNNDFATGMDKVATGWAQLKNQMGAAFGPVLNAALPVLQAIGNAAIEAFNALSQLIALLSGRSTWSRATKNSTEYAAETEKAVGGASSKVKELLADFDELTVIASESGGGGGGAAKATADDFENMFEEVSEFEGWIKDLVGYLQNNIPIVHGLVAGLASALLGLPTSISIGIGFLVTGIEEGFAAGEDIKINGLSDDSFRALAHAALKGALGGLLIGVRFGISGAIIGAVLGLGITLVAASIGASDYEGTMNNLSIQDLKNVIIGALAAGLGGAIIGLSMIGGPGGALVGLSAGLAITMLAASIGFGQFDGLINNLSSQEIQNTIIAAVGAVLGGAVMGIKLLGGVGGALVGITAGLGITLIGLLTWQKGYEYGEDGFLDEEELKNTVTDGLKVALGSAIVGWKLGGVPGAIIGFTIGTGIYLGTFLAGFDKARLESLYGDLQLTATEVQLEIDDLFTFDVTAYLANAKVDSETLQTARTNLQKAMEAAEADYVTYKTKPDEGTAQQLAKSIADAIEEANTLLTEEQKKIDLGFGFSSVFDDPSQVQATLTNDITSISEYITGLGETIGEMIQEGATKGFDENGLLDSYMQKLGRITAAITSGKASGEFVTKMQRGFSQDFDWSNASLDTLKQYTDQYNQAVKDVEEAAETHAQDTKATLGAVAAGRQVMEEEKYGVGKVPEEIMNEIWKSYNEYDPVKAAKEFVDNATAEGRKTYSQNVLSSLNHAGQNLDGMKSIGYLSDLKNGTMDPVEFLQKNLANNLGWSSRQKEFVDVMDMVDITGWDIMSNKAKSDLFKSMLRVMGDKSSTWKTLKKSLNIPIKDILMIRGWDNLNKDTKKEFAMFLKETFDDDNTIQEFIESGGELAEEFKQALLEGLSDMEPDDLKKSVIGTLTDEDTWNEMFERYSAYMEGAVQKSAEEVQKFIDENWELVFPIFEELDFDSAIELLGSIIVQGGDEAQKLLKEWDLVVPLLDTEGFQGSVEILKASMEIFGRDFDVIVTNWKLIAPGIDTENLYASLQELYKFLQESGVTLDIVIKNWQFIAPSVSGIDLDKSITTIKKIAHDTGLSIEDVISNWHLIAPNIDKDNVDSSASKISGIITESGANWKERLKNIGLTTQDVNTPKNFGDAAVKEAAGVAGKMASGLKVAASPVTVPGNFGTGAEQAATTLKGKVENAMKTTIPVAGVAQGFDQNGVNAAGAAKTAMETAAKPTIPVATVAEGFDQNGVNAASAAKTAMETGMQTTVPNPAVPEKGFNTKAIAGSETVKAVKTAVESKLQPTIPTPEVPAKGYDTKSIAKSEGINSVKTAVESNLQPTIPTPEVPAKGYDTKSIAKSEGINSVKTAVETKLKPTIPAPAVPEKGYDTKSIAKSEGIKAVKTAVEGKLKTTVPQPGVASNWGKTVLDSATQLGKDAKKNIATEVDKLEPKIDMTVDITAKVKIDPETSDSTKTKVENLTARSTTKFTSIAKAAGAYDIPSGDLFIANEAGAELVGSINGKSSVANQYQIIEGIQKGVSEANEQQNSLLREQNSLLRAILEKTGTGGIPGASAALGRIARQSLDMYSGLVGG